MPTPALADELLPNLLLLYFCQETTLPCHTTTAPHKNFHRTKLSTPATISCYVSTAGPRTPYTDLQLTLLDRAGRCCPYNKPVNESCRLAAKTMPHYRRLLIIHNLYLKHIIYIKQYKIFSWQHIIYVT